MLAAFAAAVSAGLVPDKILGLSRASDLAQRQTGRMRG